MRFYLLILTLVPAWAFATFNDLTATIGIKSLLLPASCVASVASEKPDLSVDSAIFITLKNPCSKQLADFTAQNIGHNLTIRYDNKEFQTALIASRLSASFRIKITNDNVMIARQLINDAQ